MCYYQNSSFKCKSLQRSLQNICPPSSPPTLPHDLCPHLLSLRHISNIGCYPRELWDYWTPMKYENYDMYLLFETSILFYPSLNPQSQAQHLTYSKHLLNVDDEPQSKTCHTTGKF